MISTKKIAVLVSGGGTNLQALIDEKIPIEIVISSKSESDAYALTRAKNNEIKTAIVEWDKYKPLENGRRIFTEKILTLLQNHKIELVVAAGFMVILDELLCKVYSNAIVNVHPSLIPSFSGEGFYGIKVHKAALERGVKLTGATVHFVNEICDGGPIIFQKSVEVCDDDTPETLQKRVMEVEREILPLAIKQIMIK
ncbi:MAG: phosphoribosylglycinamide formyltransferase [Oscillospiraceae bacterium]|nr:phosphoribosylglycinamide formyltransferase [Oscillospiraceae bacterium]